MKDFSPFRLAAVVLTLGSMSALPARAETSPPWPGSGDPVLEELVAEALRNRPEIKQADAAVRADRERIPQATALPDPMLSLGIQNDGFGEIMIGEMETSFYSIGLSQGFYWPGKRDLRGKVASLGVRQSEAAVARARLSTEADVRRGYVDLLLVRGQLTLLEKLETLWRESEKLAKARYEVGEGPQSDMLRAQLERTRLRQQRFTLEAAERTRIQALNRLRVRPLDEPIPTGKKIVEMPDPAISAYETAVADAEARSPELAQARAVVEQSARQLDLARKERYPDFSLNAGVMPRGRLDPMWQAGISVNLPIWSGRKQQRAVAESAERREAGSQGEESIRQAIRLRTQERLSLLDAVTQTSQLYRSGLLVQSEATVSSTLAQYQVGRVPFASVLEALGGWIADQGGFLESIAQAQLLAIAQAEVSLDPPPGAESAMGNGGSGGMGTTTTGGRMGASGGAAGTGMSLGGMSLGAGAQAPGAAPAGPARGGGM